MSGKMRQVQLCDCTLDHISWQTIQQSSSPHTDLARTHGFQLMGFKTQSSQCFEFPDFIVWLHLPIAKLVGKHERLLAEVRIYKI